MVSNPFANSPMYQRCVGFCRERRKALLIAAGTAVGVLVVVLLSLGIWNTFYRTHEEAAILGIRHWERSLEIEEYRAIEESQWYGAPKDAYDVNVRWEIHHWNRVQTGTRSVSYSCGTTKSPRTCTRSEPVYTNVPVYANKYYYKINRWKTDEWLKTSGTEQAPAFATPPAGLVDMNVLGNRRVGDGRKEKYWFDLSCPGCDDGSSVKLDFEDWSRLRSGQMVTAYVNSRGTVRGIDI